MSLTIRIMLSLSLMAVTGFAVFLNPILDRVERQYSEAIEEPMVDMAEVLAALLSNQDENQLAVPETWRRAMESVKSKTLNAKIYNLSKDKILMDFYVTDAHGTVLYDSGNSAQTGADYSNYLDIYKTLNGDYGARTSRSDENDPASAIMYVGAPIMNGNDVVGVLSVYKPQRSMLLFIIETKRLLIQLGLLALGLVLLFGWLLSKWVTKPLRTLTEYAAAVTRGERPKAPVMPGKHLRILGETTEAMREALEDRKYVETYVQSLSHEMKSPIAGIRGASELLQEDLPLEKQKQFHSNIKTESLRLQNLVQQLLALSSLENRTELGAPTEVSLKGLVEHVVDKHQSDLFDREIGFKVNVPEDFVLMGEAFLLEAALNNLVQNAMDFSPNSGVISVFLEIGKDKVCLLVKDEGPGIPDYALERIFDRFYSLPRPDSGHKSSGLGLCFAREAVELHRGSLKLRNRKDAAGVEAVIELPQ